MKKKKKRKNDIEEISSARLEFQHLWISYKILHSRLTDCVERDRLGFDAKMFYLFFAFWILFMSSYDYANASRAASDKAIYDTLVYPKFQASDLDTTMPPTTTPTSDTTAPNLIPCFFGSHDLCIGDDSGPPIRPHLINYHGIKSIQDYNTWLKDVLLNNIYINPVYNPVTGREESVQLHDQQSILWGVAIRQHRAMDLNKKR